MFTNCIVFYFKIKFVTFQTFSAFMAKSRKCHLFTNFYSFVIYAEGANELY